MHDIDTPKAEPDGRCVFNESLFNTSKSFRIMQSTVVTYLFLTPFPEIPGMIITTLGL